MTARARLNVDGGSRGNPGIAGLGFYLADEAGNELMRGGWYLTRATNNVAEYSALVWGLENALAAGVTDIDVKADSELMVKQMLGAYKVKSEDLKPLHMQAKNLFAAFESAKIAHVYRSENSHPDVMANEAMDARGPVGTFVKPWEQRTTNLFDGFDFNEADASIATSAASPEPSPSGAAYNDFMREEAPAPAIPVQAPDLSSTAAVPSESFQKGSSPMQKNERYTGPGQLSGRSYEEEGGRYELTVKDHFDAAHALPGYDGPCQYLHGHTWDVEITVVGSHLDSVGIIYDFKDIKRDLHNVLENFDHRYINDTPPFDSINPTAENLARVIFYELMGTFPEGVVLQEVSVWESPAAKLSYRP